MSKYIDADKLIAEIEKRAKFHDDAMKACAGLNNIAITHSAGWKEDTELLAIIASLQQEQLEATSIKGYLSRDIGGQLIFSLSPNYMDDEWMLLESKLFPKIKSGDAPRCVNIIIKEIK